ncbi:MAG: NHLP bacteriocin system secretion protein [Cyanobacteriota bacterium]|nr:NHLP bacteriocin system secretion protein [Cyanobacteriota bacterium]
MTARQAPAQGPPQTPGLVATSAPSAEGGEAAAGASQEPEAPRDPESDHRQLGLCLAAMAGAIGLWGLVWPVPTEVTGQGVLIYPGTAGLLNARASGQVRELRVRSGDRVRRGDVLMTLHLPVLERQLQQQRGNLDQLERQNRALDERDAIRLDTARAQRDTALAKLADDRRRYAGLQTTYASKLKRLQWLAGREVVAPLASEVVTAEQGLTSTSVALDGVVVSEKEAVSAFQKVKLEVETAALQRRYQIDDLRREIQVTRARLAYDGDVVSGRDGVVLDLQVIPGQTVGLGQRLGTIGRPQTADGQAPPLQAVAYFAPADARRLPLGLPVEVVPQWNQRGRFGGIVGRVTRVLTLPATPDDIATTTGNPQLAEALAKGGPVLRSDIELLRDPRSNDGYRWTLSAGSAVFPVREGLTVNAHAYVEWRSPLSYLIPGLRSLTGGFRRHPYDRQLDRPFLRQP